MTYTKYTKALLENAVKNSKSVSDVMRYLGLKQAGGTHFHLSKKIKNYGIDTSHFFQKYKGNSGPNHKGGPKKKTHKDILILRTSGSRGKTYQLVRALKEVGIKYECKECGIGNDWNNKSLTLQVDHIDGNWLDDRLENLRFLCPNCHSQTDNFSKPKGT